MDREDAEGCVEGQLVTASATTSAATTRAATPFFVGTTIIAINFVTFTRTADCIAGGW
jgi:hypothetical protein